MIKLATYLFLGTCVMGAMSCHAQTGPRHDSPSTDPAPQSQWPSPEEILRSSDYLGRLLSKKERCFQLFNLADAATQLNIQEGAALSRSWSLLLFKKASEMPKDWDRGAFQKNALAILSKTDALQSVRMLRQVDQPDFAAGDAPPEDLRAFAATTIFLNAWRQAGLSALPAIRAQARFIGDTGEYPYTAMGLLLIDLTAKGQPDLAIEVAEESVQYFSRGTRVGSADRDFVEATETDWSSLPNSLRLQYIRAIVSHLDRPEALTPLKIYASTITTDKGSEHFQNEKRELLFRILPKVREVDPQEADELLEEHNDLKASVAAGGSYMSTSTFTLENANDSSGPLSQALIQRGLQGGILSQVRKLAGSNLSAASELTSQIHDPEYSVEAMSVLAQDGDPERRLQSDKWMKDAEGMLAKVKDPYQRVRALLSLANAAASRQQIALMNRFITLAFSQAEENIAEDLDIHPGMSVYLTKNLRDLDALTKLGAEYDPAAMDAHIREVSSDTIRAYVLIDFALGVHKRASKR